LFDWLALGLIGHLHYYTIVLLCAGLSIQFSRWFCIHDAVASRWCQKSLPWVVLLFVLIMAGNLGNAWLQERVAVAKLPVPPLGLPNILVIIVDTLRADHLACYGYLRPTSPNIDRISHQGTLFENAFSTSSWTLPAHASLVTGRYPYEHQASLKPLDDRYPTIAEVLRAHGYRTGAFSANALFFNRSEGFGRGFTHFEDYSQSVSDLARRTIYGHLFELYILRLIGFEDMVGRKRGSAINDSFLKWLDRDQGRPFFAMLNYFDTHDPYLPTQPYRNKFSKFKNPGGIINTFVGREYPKMTPEQLQGEIDAYDGAIAYVDEQIGRVFKELQRRGVGKNTLVVITSDHGESFGEHGLLQHENSLYREVIHVPLIFWWPGHVTSAVRLPYPVSIAALPASLMTFVGTEKQAVFPGPPLVQFKQTSQAGTQQRFVLAELSHFPWAPIINPAAHGAITSLVSSQWHYIYHEKLGPKLYDWKNDPKELRNLAHSPDMQATLDWFKASVAGLTSRLGKLAGRTPTGN